VAKEKRFQIAIAVYAVIAILEWFTLDGRVRIVAFAVLALFAVRTVAHQRRRELEEKAEAERSRE
jgi:hypothetical protein